MNHHSSLILQTMMRVLLPLILVLSLFLLLRGQNAPGSGIASGLLAAAAVLLHIVVAGPSESQRIMPVSPLTLAALGLLIIVVWGSVNLIAGLPFLTSFWMGELIPGLGEIGTATFVNIGVYMVVAGLISQGALLLAEFAAEREQPAPERSTPP
jgi:multicomponent Na+:H+ antiporter subunit B